MFSVMLLPIITVPKRVKASITRPVVHVNPNVENLIPISGIIDEIKTLVMRIFSYVILIVRFCNIMLQSPESHS